jgi:hypothetical protein
MITAVTITATTIAAAITAAIAGAIAEPGQPTSGGRTARSPADADRAPARPTENNMEH